jgi:hypothetical protein
MQDCLSGHSGTPGEDCKIIKSGDKGSVSASRHKSLDYIFIAELFVGNPPQRVRGVFDTGSSNMWILNKKTDKRAPKYKPLSYDDTASKTCKKTT